MKTLILLALAAGAGWVVWESRSDLQRYRRIREM